jgi:hypothetical protein
MLSDINSQIHLTTLTLDVWFSGWGLWKDITQRNALKVNRRFTGTNYPYLQVQRRSQAGYQDETDSKQT